MSNLSHQKRSLSFHVWRSFTQRYRRSRPSSSVRQRPVTCSTESSPARLCRTIRSRRGPEPHYKAGQDAGARHDRTGATARQYRCGDANRASRPPSATTRFTLRSRRCQSTALSGCAVDFFVNPIRQKWRSVCEPQEHGIASSKLEHQEQHGVLTLRGYWPPNDLPVSLV